METVTLQDIDGDEQEVVVYVMHDDKGQQEFHVTTDDERPVPGVKIENIIPITGLTIFKVDNVVKYVI